ncbi:hypothetical protein JTE90_004849 [Oedothorax gibbosus]|uniref:Peptidase M12B domain-containing protein n=1 Tax=Oedothorax gibbosus TaxID=931172 RepID=A0AAV6UTZ7_9ARAC|nr:hypothetical protein JTE90_004849 [Oedothorax gibbosus]
MSGRVFIDDDGIAKGVAGNSWCISRKCGSWIGIIICRLFDIGVITFIKMDALKEIIICCIIHFVVVSSFPQSFDFHKRLSKDQLQKYFSVQDHDEVPEYNLVNIRLKKSSPPPTTYTPTHVLKQRGGGHKVHQSGFTFIATSAIFGHDGIQFQLRPNSRLLAPSFKVVEMADDQGGRQMDRSFYPLCHYIGSNGSFAAAVSDCGSSAAKGLSGILMLPSGSAQIQPVDKDLAELLGISLPPERLDKRSGTHAEEDLLHLIFKPPQQKRLSVPDELWEDEQYLPPSPRSEYELDDEDIVKYLDFDDLGTNSVDKSSKSDKSEEESVAKRQDMYAKSPKQLYLELAVFFDQKGYELFQPHVKSDESMVDLILGFVNQMQALYQQPTLNKKIQISLVRLEMMKKQPADLPHSDGDRDKLLDAFCAYQAKKNPDSDSDPNHWDLALYISGLNFFAMEKGKKNGITMGLAPVGGVCMKKHACVITEFGTTSDDGRPYPSAGLLSTYIAAHEIGHNLGMYHDGPPNNDCPANGHVMSPSRGTKGRPHGPSVVPKFWRNRTIESFVYYSKKCLFDEPQGSPSKGKDHEKFKEKPGQMWDAHDQCKVFLRDEDATLFNETVISICSSWISTSQQLPGFLLWKRLLFPYFNAEHLIG